MTENIGKVIVFKDIINKKNNPEGIEVEDVCVLLGDKLVPTEHEVVVTNISGNMATVKLTQKTMSRNDGFIWILLPDGSSLDLNFSGTKDVPIKFLKKS